MKTGTLTKRTTVISVLKDGQECDVVLGISNCARKYGIRVQNLWKTLNGYKTTLAGYEFRRKESV